VQQVLYESLPHFCKLCNVLGHNSTAWRKGSSERKKRPQNPQQGSGSPSAYTVAVEKQQLYSQGPPVDTLVDPMTTETATSALRRHASPGRKRTKLATSSTAKQA